MGFDDLVESRILEAYERGLFRGLPGEGKPLPARPYEWAAGENWLAFHLLEINGLLPEWLELAREIHRDAEALRAIDGEHAEICRIAAASPHPERFRPALERFRSRYEAGARRLRAKQERFNAMAPGPATQRLPIWVEYHLERLRRREEAALAESPEAHT
ncbi:MAG: DUF1992 domain-containing protein [Chloroflexota bacterium]|nr:DUF1992 domain-containing protein [Dehalococcoidia bacterium]MDW8047448.1 DUF1992 domain-containing protein [Chloroflexota bacterium]